MVLAILLFYSGMMILAASAEATMTSADSVEIMFETTSPYYQPKVALVPPGASIRWVNATASHHTVRHDGCLAEEACAFQSIAVPPDSDFAIAPLPPGRYAYHCELHPIMRGTLIVHDSQRQSERADPPPKGPP